VSSLNGKERGSFSGLDRGGLGGRLPCDGRGWAC